jgi:hypothetical protein
MSQVEQRIRQKPADRIVEIGSLDPRPVARRKNVAPDGQPVVVLFEALKERAHMSLTGGNRRSPIGDSLSENRGVDQSISMSLGKLPPLLAILLERTEIVAHAPPLAGANDAELLAPDQVVVAFRAMARAASKGAARSAGWSCPRPSLTASCHCLSVPLVKQGNRGGDARLWIFTSFNRRAG